MTPELLDKFIEVMRARGALEVETPELKIKLAPPEPLRPDPADMIRTLEDLDRASRQGTGTGIGPSAGYLGQAFVDFYGDRRAGPRDTAEPEPDDEPEPA